MEPTTDQNVMNKLNEAGEQLDDIQDSVHGMRRIFFWTMVITLALVILPILGLVFFIPSFVETYTGGLGL